MLYFFEHPVKYVDEDGNIKDKSTSLSTIKSESVYADQYGYASQENDIKTYFPKDLNSGNGIKLDWNELTIELIPFIKTAQQETVSKFALSTGKNEIQEPMSPTKESVSVSNQDRDSIVYNKVFGDNSYVRYMAGLNGFKEDIVLLKNTGENEFSFRLKTNGLSLVKENGSYYLKDPLTGEKKLQMSEIIVYDSAQTQKTNSDALQITEIPAKSELSVTAEEDSLYFPDESPELTYNHHYEVQTVRDDNEYLLTIVIDKEYLNNKDTVYPVTIDPSFSVAGSSFEDATIYSNYFVNEGGAANMFVGSYTNRYGGSKGVARSLIKFPGLFNNSTFKDLPFDRISSVQYIVRDTMCESDGAWIDCYRVTSDWEEYDVKNDEIIWDAYTGLLDENYISYNKGTGSDGTGTGNWYSFDITEAVGDWKSGY